MLLVDIGNTRVHIYNGNRVIHLKHQEAIDKYTNQKIYYIIVKHQLKSKFNSLENWIDISDKIKLPNAYSTMGIDRQALCLSHRDGIFVSAGTAITVDIINDGIYQGGFLLPGIKAYLNAYANISPALKTNLNSNISLDTLPQTTKDGISYGIIASIKMLIEKSQKSKQLYISGGDGELIASFFDNAIFDEKLIFEGMKNALKD
ncbi:MAG TPA: type III pantothenate kinase [Campylobacterales bacterium]|nr:type III pantothenate kinase [Campylobacterales bacterium]HHH51762.1 type III pantothenate kinase [Campylobacterales bacterium]